MDGFSGQVLVRFVSGAIIGGIAFFVFGLRLFLRQVARDHFPTGYVLLFIAAGGVIAACTTPRESWPWIE
jgi:hypothetical protein